MSMAIKYQMAKKARGNSKACDEHGAMGCKMCGGGKMMAEGGEMEDDDDIVGRAMKKRKGEPVADFEKNDFEAEGPEDVPDDADYTGANSGDELGNEALDKEDEDVVARAMRSRKKGDRNPRPA